MTKKLRLNTLIGRGPLCFKNFYDYHKLRGVDFYNKKSLQFINEALKNEPCNVKLTHESEYIYDNPPWHLEFETEDDYTAFMLRWS